MDDGGGPGGRRTDEWEESVPLDASGKRSRKRTKAGVYTSGEEAREPFQRALGLALGARPLRPLPVPPASGGCPVLKYHAAQDLVAPPSPTRCDAGGPVCSLPPASLQGVPGAGHGGEWGRRRRCRGSPWRGPVIVGQAGRQTCLSGRRLPHTCWGDSRAGSLTRMARARPFALRWLPPLMCPPPAVP